MSETRSHLWPGVPLALGSAALFGATPPLSKLLLDAVNPFMLAGLLYLGAGLGLALYRLLRGKQAAAGEAQLAARDIPWLALAIGMGGILGPVLLMFGLSLNTASSSALMLNLEGLATMAIAWLVYRENVDRRLLFGAFAILAGAVLLSWDGGGVAFNQGALLVAGACVAWGLDNNFTRRISATDPVVIAMLKGLVAGAANVALALAAGAPFPTMSIVAATAAVGFLGIGVSLAMFILALRHLGTARTGAYYSLAPFIGALLAIVMLGDAVTLKLLVAGLLMAVGLWLHLSERHEHEHDHEALEHEHSHVHDEHHQHDHDGPVSEPHSHWHRHAPMRHRHPHYPDLHHRHSHG
ncbi:DMT family transporter [Mesorhizobium intechi]|uniref:DMT family transporter n=1 Tax=Mesorhizobium intechi TaxID=537601 RepID=UPI000CCAA94B|nr:DMT family transporter [Mesorhizobium intechi]TSE01340.1 DMT family transporter [Mesorhizobium intechi]